MNGGADEGESLLRRRVKAELRKRMRGLRMAMPASACAERSARIVDRLLALDVVAGARAVALFWPIEERHEVDLRAAGARLAERGVRVAYPAIDPETREMLFRFVDQPDAMIEQGFGFQEPSSREPEALAGELDAIVVPALAVDPRGHRVGYGAGYYDRTLAALPGRFRLGVAYAASELDEVPAGPYDQRLDAVATERGVIPLSRAAGEG